MCTGYEMALGSLVILLSLVTVLRIVRKCLCFLELCSEVCRGKMMAGAPMNNSGREKEGKKGKRQRGGRERQQ